MLIEPLLLSFRRLASGAKNWANGNFINSVPAPPGVNDDAPAFIFVNEVMAPVLLKFSLGVPENWGTADSTQLRVVSQLDLSKASAAQKFWARYVSENVHKEFFINSPD